MQYFNGFMSYTRWRYRGITKDIGIDPRFFWEVLLFHLYTVGDSISYCFLDCYDLPLEGRRRISITGGLVLRGR